MTDKSQSYYYVKKALMEYFLLDIMNLGLYLSSHLLNWQRLLPCRTTLVAGMTSDRVATSESLDRFWISIQRPTS